MRRLLVLMFCFFSLVVSLPLWAYSETVMVTMVDVGMEPLEEASKEKAAGLENGLMDSLFENGIIFFTSSLRKSLGEMKKGNASLVSAVGSGADYLVEISFEQEKQVVLYAIYDIEGKDLLKKGEISLPQGTKEEQKEFCRKTGSSIASELYVFLNE